MFIHIAYSTILLLAMLHPTLAHVGSPYVKMCYFWHGAHAFTPANTTHRIGRWHFFCGVQHIEMARAALIHILIQRQNSKQSLLRSVPSRQTSAKIKPLWSKNTSRAREPTTGWRREQTERERWGRVVLTGEKMRMRGEWSCLLEL